MNKVNFEYIFQNAFDTFKVFETIPFEISGTLIEGHSKTIWQTLNHLISWRAHQLLQLKNRCVKIDFIEAESWITQTEPTNLDEWKKAINIFNKQTEKLQKIILQLDSSEVRLEEKLKLIQDSSTHLCFHLGEIILIARQKNKYPKQSEMNEFLKE